MDTNPEKAMMLAVKGMLPDTVIGRDSLRRLRVYKDAEHQNAAQNLKLTKYKEGGNLNVRF